MQPPILSSLPVASVAVAAQPNIRQRADGARSYHRRMRAPHRPLNGGHVGWRPLIAAGLPATRIDDVLSLYDGPQRVYHDRRHLRRMLCAAGRMSLRLSAAQALAVLFHDAVYVPGARHGANEALSAQLLRVYAQGMAPSIVDEAAAIVSDTAQHLPSLPSAALVIDLDLLRLAGTSEQFDRDSRDVFAEMRPLFSADDEAEAWRQFAARRRSFFVRLLARPRIYTTPPIFDRCEAAARANLRAAISGSESRGTA
jgi:predicted metal-dependent HD superfamily phosphohydrolase